jgi:hypothetical protein
MLRIPILVLLPIAATGCGGLQRRSAVPVDLQDRAVVSGMPSIIRTWADDWGKEFADECMKATGREVELMKAKGQTGPLPPSSILAISGGGSNGAFGAGLLCGWTEAGTRPNFKAVTGISTGALTAPFAFLGKDYDDRLRKLYTSVETSDILKKRGLVQGVLRDALTDNRPLWELLRVEVDDRMVAAIAEEYAKGRLLLIMTTNLDAQRPVVWNMTAIAASGHPNALRLFHSIMIASAAIPAAFPPEMINVEVDGRPFQEMHVDGGAMAQVFLYPPSFHLKELSEAHGVFRDRSLYIVRNARLDPAWGEVERKTLKIAGRAISSLIQSQGIGDLYRLYLNARRDSLRFHLAFIPADFKAVPKEEFDPVYMRQLFDAGYALARTESLWQSVPPGWDE